MRRTIAGAPACALAACAALATGCADGAPADPGPPWSVSDSAGVAVVENRRPARPPGRAWRMEAEPTLVLGRPDAPGQGEFGRPVDARFLDDGGLVVADGGFVGWQLVVVFDSAGEAVASCGGAGGARERLQRLEWAAGWPGDSVVAFDAGDRTLAIYPVPPPDRQRWSGPGSPGRELECDPGREVALPAATVHPPRGGTLLGEVQAPAGRWGAPDTIPGPPGVVRFPQLLLRIGADGAHGTAGDTLALAPSVEVLWDGTRSSPLPYPADASVAVTDSGVVHAPGRPFEVRVHGPDGRLERIVRRAWEPEPPTAADRERWVAWRGGRRMSGTEASTRETRERLLRELRWPETMPATSDVLVADDGSIWVEAWRWVRGEVPPDPPPTTWSVFSPRGRWITDVEVPGRFLLTDVRGDRVVGIWLGERGSSEVRVHRLVR